MISCMDEFSVIVKIARLLQKVPTKSEPWIQYKPHHEDDGPLVGAIDEVTITIAGMPLFWKIVNMVIIVVPKFMLWTLTAKTGCVFLMETSDIDDLIVNSVGLTFILGIDELIFSALMSEETLNFVEAAQDFCFYDKFATSGIATLTDDEVLARYKAHHHGLNRSHFKAVVPIKLLMSFGFTCLFIGDYYMSHCNLDSRDASRLVSKTMYLPKNIIFTW